MRIPHIIDANTILAYAPSPETLALLHEPPRLLRAEDFAWDAGHPPPLADLCTALLATRLDDEPVADPAADAEAAAAAFAAASAATAAEIFAALTCPDRNHLLALLPLTLPLELVIPLIDDEFYWRRRHNEAGRRPLPAGYTWKRLHLEWHVERAVEACHPEMGDERDMEELNGLCAPYVRRMVIKELQMWRPPSHWDEEDIPEVHPIEHIDFSPLFKQLPNIEEFSLMFGMNDVGEKFTWNMFKVSVLDCQRLEKAINLLKNLKILRIHKSRLDCDHMRALSQGLAKNQTIELLDLSHCECGDVGALCLAKVLTVHPVLRDLNLCDNRIGMEGGEGLGWALLHPECKLERLNVKLNPLKEGGAMGIMRALVRGTTLVELSMATCLLDEDGPIRVGQMLELNSSLRKLDVSNNWLDEEGGDAIIFGLSINRSLEWLDLRETDITNDQLKLIKKLLIRNRLGKDEIEESEEEVEEEEIEEVEEEEVKEEEKEE